MGVAWALMNCVFFTVELIIADQWNRKRFDWVRELPGWEIISLLITGLNGIFILCSNLTVVYGFAHMPTFISLTFFGNGAWKVYFFVLLCTFSWCLVQRESRKRECPFAGKANPKVSTQ